MNPIVAPIEPLGGDPCFEPADRAARAASGERGHPLALAMWGLLRDRSVADKALVLTACDRRLGRKDMPEKQERAAYAISLFVADAGRVPHATEWDGWRRAKPSRAHLPSATFIRNAFGGWTAMRASLASEPNTDVLSARLLALGPHFSDDELLVILRAWADDVSGPLRWVALRAWLKSGRPAAVGLERAPRDAQPFRRLGRFEELLESAGLGHRRATARRRTYVADPAVRRALVTELHLWAQNTSGLLFQCDFVAHWRQLDLTDDPALAAIRPTDRALRAFLGGWTQALSDVGLAHRSPRSRPGGLRPTKPNLAQPAPRVGEVDAEALALWVQAAAADGSGAQMSYPEYDQWRKRRLETAAAEGRPLEAIPSSMKLRSTVGGSWYDVKVMAGVPGAVEFADARRHRRGYSAEAVVAAVRGAMQAHADRGGSPSAVRPSEYVRWRAGELARHRAAGSVGALPTVDVVRLVLGGPERLWAAAVQAALTATNADGSTASGSDADAARTALAETRARS